MAVLSQNALEGIRTAEATLGFEPLPEGEYTVKVDSTDLKPTRSGTGQYINVELVVLGPKYQGRKLFTRYNIINDSMEAMRIGRQQIKSLMTASGMTQEQINQFNDTDQLLGLTCNVLVGIDEGNEQYGAQNRIKRYKKAEVVSAPTVSGGSVEPFTKPAAASANGASSSSAWFK